MKNFFLVVLLLSASSAMAQQLSNARQHFFLVDADTVKIDSLSIIPGSLFLLKNGVAVDTANFKVDYAASLLIWLNRDAAVIDTLLMVYRVFPVLFARE